MPRRVSPLIPLYFCASAKVTCSLAHLCIAFTAGVPRVFPLINTSSTVVPHQIQNRFHCLVEGRLNEHLSIIECKNHSHRSAECIAEMKHRLLICLGGCSLLFRGPCFNRIVRPSKTTAGNLPDSAEDCRHRWSRDNVGEYSIAAHVTPSCAAASRKSVSRIVSRFCNDRSPAATDGERSRHNLFLVLGDCCEPVSRSMSSKSARRLIRSILPRRFPCRDRCG